jgi:hypothetical protein
LPKYKLTFYATDGTADAEMFCFNNIGKQIIGKPCEFLIRTLSSSWGTPSDLYANVGLKFTFAVNINIKSYYVKERILNVNPILQAHGRQQMSMGFHAPPQDEATFRTDDSSLPMLTQDSLATALQKLSTSLATSSISPLHTFIIIDQK